MIMTLGLVAVAFFAIGPVAAEASNNYYYPSLGGYQYQYQPVYTPAYSYTTPTYSYSNNMSQSQLADYLRVLIVQLQSQISSRPSYNYYGGAYGYNYVIGGPRSSDNDWDDDDNNDDDEPTVETRSATNISDDEATLRGYVDMNDFEDGEVFFVYGTDEDQIDEVEDDFDSYSDVDTDGDNLRKVRVDSSLDDSRTYGATVSLDEDTRYYFSMCVSFEDEDNDDVIVCDSTEDFETDN